MGEEKGRQTGVTRGSPASRRERADGPREAPLAVDKEKVLGSLVSPATAAVTAEQLQGCWILQFFRIKGSFKKNAKKKEHTSFLSSSSSGKGRL